ARASAVRRRGVVRERRHRRYSRAALGLSESRAEPRRARALRLSGARDSRRRRRFRDRYQRRADPSANPRQRRRRLGQRGGAPGRRARAAAAAVPAPSLRVAAARLGRSELAVCLGHHPRYLFSPRRRRPAALRLRSNRVAARRSAGGRQRAGIARGKNRRLHARPQRGEHQPRLGRISHLDARRKIRHRLGRRGQEFFLGGRARRPRHDHQLGRGRAGGGADHRRRGQKIRALFTRAVRMKRKWSAGVMERRSHGRARRFAIFIALVGELLLATGSASAAPPAQVRISYSSRSNSNTPFIVALNKGFFAEEGMEVELIQVNPRLGATAVLNGDLDFTTTFGTTLRGILGGFPIKFVAVSVKKSEHFLVVRPEIKDFRDLNGKKLGVAT